MDEITMETLQQMEKLKKTRIEQNRLRELSDKAFTYLENKDKIGLSRFIDQNSNSGVALVTDFINIRGFTLLHMACFKNLEEIAARLVEKAQNQAIDAQIKEWVNLKTHDDGFTALHYASFRGNIVLIKLLIKNGADINSKNKFGINMLHVAA